MSIIVSWLKFYFSKWTRIGTLPLLLTMIYSKEQQRVDTKSSGHQLFWIFILNLMLHWIEHCLKLFGCAHTFFFEFKFYFCHNFDPNVLCVLLQFAQLINTYNKLGADKFPLVDQTFYSNYRDMVRSLAFIPSSPETFLYWIEQQ